MQTKYATSLIALHWLTLLLLILAYGTVELREFAQPGSWHGYAIAITHITAGATVLVTMSLRLLLRMRKRSPQIVPKPPGWQTGLAHLTHTCLYALFIAIPASALLSRYYYGGEWSLYGLPMPHADIERPEMWKGFNRWHTILAPLGYWLIGLHAAAALIHHYILRDNTLLRMMPSRSGRNMKS
ncbi:cytochrome b561 [Erwinia sp. V71]|uniref:cytochrome b561 n=1 Tax=Erwinia sp. V71 TaxID=3369424 RepID=UPI003F631FBE